jgi:hypothetical protein
MANDCSAEIGTSIGVTLACALLAFSCVGACVYAKAILFVGKR